VLVEDRSLRCVVEKWFGRGSGEPIRVNRVSHARRGRNRSSDRCVRVCLPRPVHSVTIFFFRHEDGSWSVVPPAR